MLARTVTCGCKPAVSAEFGAHGSSAIAVESSERLYAEQQIRPSNGLSAYPFEFVIEPQENTFACLGNMTLNVSLKLITKVEGNDITHDTKAAPVNDAMASLWSHVQVRINDHELNSETGFHLGYKGVISKQL